MAITLTQYWMGRDVKYPPSDEQIENATDLLEKIALLEEELGIDFQHTKRLWKEQMA